MHALLDIYLGEGLAYFLSLLGSELLVLHALEQQDELIAAITALDVIQPRLVAHNIGKGFNEAVPGIMPIGIVHLLEIIQIE